ncbi:acylneuraminate cytidylyltransferase family protein [Verminephrobacter aporrectodeae subsp. tuberculatae]|uniref:acylneuraminate cytidylyltransferase family protein n=1 Tax=Verminephrobacter aporrectodeae TaxID=1110389 RepID=UPI0022436860|nr:acylneuraminate cytidylyltransferase family protein [Verminephrobacter aporrectodeae]MCW8164696.1 acylneuraminate cytidylyltransferase family protein [Verminephrobacter aporrectodeae subsp. tuberculatae]MCW8169364.1 acylneuraminate cytidylyltransferase family protein [Verminephrobacter aporrectodeae subsp. tuberculatae]
MSATAFIFARGGSKGVKNKNIYPVAGKPLIAHGIASALASQSVARVVVSTDDAQIAAVARAHGADVLERPSALADDSTPELLAWRHAIASFPQLFSGPAVQPFISLPATSPLRAAQDVDAAIAKFRSHPCDILFGVSPAHRNPYLNMVTIDAQGLLQIAIPGSSAVRRQEVPAMYDVTTCVYVGNASYIQSCTRLMQGRVGHIVIPPERALDIDSHYDIHLAQLLLTQPYPPCAKGSS